MSECRNCLHDTSEHTAQNYGHCTAWVIPLVVMCECEKADAL